MRIGDVPVWSVTGIWLSVDIDCKKRIREQFQFIDSFVDSVKGIRLYLSRECG